VLNGRSSTQGWPAGATAALGIGAGIFVHIAAAAIGLSAILAASATAFAAIKIAGAIYLVYVGISLLCSSGSPARGASTAPAPASLRTIFLQGFLTNVLNPKVALFFLAFLPQFVEPGAPSKALAFLFLGVVFNLNGTLWNLLVAWSCARIGGAARHAVFSTWFNRCVGVLFIWLGVKLAFSRD